MSGQVKEKLIVTMWRGQMENPSQFHSIYCRMLYNGQEHNTKPIPSNKSLSWKETYIFKLAKEKETMRLDFINKNDQIKEIHFAKDQVLETLSIGRSEVPIDLDNSNRGTVPAKIPILSSQGKPVGAIFLEYEILKTEVTYVVERLIDYEYMLRFKAFKLNFIRPLIGVPSFYLKFAYGDKTHKENFSFEELNSTFFYNYPVQLFIKNEPEIIIELQLKDGYPKDYRNPNTSFETESVNSYNVSIKSTTNKKIGNANKLKNQIDIHTAERIYSTLILAFKKDGIYPKKLPINMSVKGLDREIGTLQFQVEVVYKSKAEKEALEVQRKRDTELKSKNLSSDGRIKKKEKRYEPPKNGSIIVNSIIGKIELFSQDSIDGKDFSIELKLGKIGQSSAVLEDPGKDIIWMDTFIFKRTWEQNIKFIVYLHQKQTKMPTYYTEMNLRDLFEVGRYMAKKLELKDDNKNYSGYLTVDVTYKEEKQKIKDPPKAKKQPQLTLEQKEEIKRSEKQELIKERMRKRELEKRKRAQQIEMSAPTFSEKELILPPLRSSRNSSAHATLSPRRSHNMSVNMYNRGGALYFSKSPRFEQQSKKNDGSSFFFRPDSDFEKKGKRGASIGYGQKFDFTREHQLTPGIGRYHIPSVWDKYS